MIPTPFVLSCLPETPSQTAGPYVHIGLIPNQAGFDIFQNNFSGDIAGPDVAGQRIVIPRHLAAEVLRRTGAPASAALCEVSVEALRREAITGFSATLASA